MYKMFELQLLDHKIQSHSRFFSNHLSTVLASATASTPKGCIRLLQDIWQAWRFTSGWYPNYYNCIWIWSELSYSVLIGLTPFLSMTNSAKQPLKLESQGEVLAWPLLHSSESPWAQILKDLHAFKSVHLTLVTIEGVWKGGEEEHRQQRRSHIFNC